MVSNTVRQFDSLPENDYCHSVILQEKSKYFEHRTTLLPSSNVFLAVRKYFLRLGQNYQH